jgi:hypothetical protein
LIIVEPDSQLVAPTSTVSRKKRISRSLRLWVSLGVIAIVVSATGIFVANVPLSSDTLRRRMVKTLSDRLDSDVELGDLSLRVYPALRADGTDLRIRRRGSDVNVPPLITIKSFHVDGSLFGIWRKHVDHVQLTGLDISIPPKPKSQQEEHHGDDTPRPTATRGRTPVVPAPTDRQETVQERRDDPLGNYGVVIDRVDTDNARLIIMPDRQDAKPKVWAIHHLTMFRLGAPKSWPFEATLTNGVPPGEIGVKGGFGPWNRDEPGDTPLNGAFHFDNADLSVFKGISGTLASRGSFEGTLDKIHANGETDTPDFMIAVGGHTFPLHTTYRALIDGTNGDTQLEQIDARFLSSHLVAAGSVIDTPKAQHGRVVVLDVNMDRARIEDIMVMAVRTSKPPMTGALKLTTKLLLPPGESDVSQRLRLDGRFAIAQAKFANYDVQGKIDELSKRSRGDAEAQRKENVVSNFEGRFRLADARLALPDLTFAVPGATVELAGAYALKPETLDFKGHVVLDTMVSDMVTGWKRWLLKPADSIFRKPKKDGKGSVIPIKISGTRTDPKFGLDLREVFKRRG